MDNDFIYEEFVNRLRKAIPYFPQPNARGLYPFDEACNVLGIKAMHAASRNLPRDAFVGDALTSRGIMALAYISTSMKTVNLAGKICLSLLVDAAFPEAAEPHDRTEELCRAMQEVLDTFRKKERNPCDLFIF